MLITNVEENGVFVIVTFENDVTVKCRFDAVWVVHQKEVLDPFVNAPNLKPGMFIRLPFC